MVEWVSIGCMGFLSVKNVCYLWHVVAIGYIQEDWPTITCMEWERNGWPGSIWVLWGSQPLMLLDRTHHCYMCSLSFSLLCKTEAMLQAAESIGGDYLWGVYDLLVLPPSFPYGGMENPCLTFVTPTVLVRSKKLLLDKEHIFYILILSLWSWLYLFMLFQAGDKSLTNVSGWGALAMSCHVIVTWYLPSHTGYCSWDLS